MTKASDKKTVKNTKRHDNFVKQGLANLSVAKEIIEHDCPEKIVALVDMSSLKEEKTDFTDVILKSGQADCLFSGKLKNGRSGYFYFLLEAQHNR